MAGLISVEELRKRNPQFDEKGYTDLDIAKWMHDNFTGGYMSLAETAKEMGIEVPESAAGAEWEAMKSNVLGRLHHTYDYFTGSDPTQDPALRKYAQEEQFYSSQSPAPQSYEDIQFGDSGKGVWPWFRRMAIGSVGDTASAISGGLLGLAAGTAAGGPVGGAIGATAGTVAGSYPLSLGEVLQSQYEQSGEYSPNAAALGLGHAALNAVSIENPALLGLRVGGGLLRRAATKGAFGAVSEGAFNELPQAVVEEYGRTQVDPSYDMWGEQAQRNYRESLIGGGAFGLVGGGLSGVARPAKVTPNEQTDLLNTNFPAAPKELRPTVDASGYQPDMFGGEGTMSPPPDVPPDTGPTPGPPSEPPPLQWDMFDPAHTAMRRNDRQIYEQFYPRYEGFERPQAIYENQMPEWSAGLPAAEPGVFPSTPIRTPEPVTGVPLGSKPIPGNKVLTKAESDQLTIDRLMGEGNTIAQTRLAAPEIDPRQPVKSGTLGRAWRYLMQEGVIDKAPTKADYAWMNKHLNGRTVEDISSVTTSSKNRAALINYLVDSTAAKTTPAEAKTQDTVSTEPAQATLTASEPETATASVENKPQNTDPLAFLSPAAREIKEYVRDNPDASISEIGKALGISDSAVHRRLSKANEQIAAEAERLGVSPKFLEQTLDLAPATAPGLDTHSDAQVFDTAAADEMNTEETTLGRESFANDEESAANVGMSIVDSPNATKMQWRQSGTNVDTETAERDAETARLDNETKQWLRRNDPEYNKSRLREIGRQWTKQVYDRDKTTKRWAQLPESVQRAFAKELLDSEGKIGPERAAELAEQAKALPETKTEPQVDETARAAAEHAANKAQAAYEKAASLYTRMHDGANLEERSDATQAAWVDVVSTDPVAKQIAEKYESLPPSAQEKAKAHIEKLVRVAARRYRRGKRPSREAGFDTAKHKAKVERWLSRFRKRLASWVKLDVVATVDDIDAPGIDIPEGTKGVYLNGRIYIIAENITSRHDALATAVHEAVGHLGLEKMLGREKYENLLNMVQALVKSRDKYVEKIVVRLRQVYVDANGGYTLNPRQEAEEILAAIAESNPHYGPLRRIWLAIRRAILEWLNKLFDGRLTAALNNAALEQVMLRAASFIRAEHAKSGQPRLELLHVADDLGATESETVDVKFRRGGAQPIAAKIEQFLDQSPVANKLAEWYMKAAPAMQTLHSLVTNYKDSLPSLKKYYHDSLEMEATQIALATAGHKIASRWRSLPKREIQKLNSLAYDATRLGIHPEKPGKLHARWKALSKEAQEVYIAARDKLNADWVERHELYKSLAEKAYEDLIAKAKTDAERQALQEELDRIKRQADKAVESLKGPYFPLLRHGDFIAIYKSQEFADTENALADAIGDERHELEKKLARLRRQAKHYRVVAAESLHELKRDLRENEGKYASVVSKLSVKHDPKGQDITARGYEVIKDHLKALGDSEVAAEIDRMITELYISSLPENHALARGLNRKNVEGASKDMLRSFASTVEKNSFYLSRFKYSDVLAKDLQNIKREADAGDLKTQQVYAEILKRRQLDLEYKETPIQNALAKMSGMWHLVSPSYWLVNSTQPWLIGAPVIASKYGMGRTLNALRSAFVDAARLVRDTVRPVTASGKRIYTPFAELDISNFGTLEEREMLQTLIDRGRIDINIMHDLGVIARGGSDKLSRAATVSMWPAHQIETVNRLMVALASYRLAKANGESHKAAVAIADRMIVDTQVDYSDINAPRPMKHGAVPLGKLIFQFRKYQHAMAQLILNNARLAFKGDKEALKAIEYMVLMQLATAGLAGVPAYSTIMFVLDALGDDDDDDERGDAHTRLRNWLADQVGPDLARVIMKGPLGTALNTDLSKRTGLGDVFSPLPFLRTGFSTGQEGLGNILVAAGGASMGMAATILNATVYAETGDYAKMVESVLPKGLKDVLRAGRYATEGLTKRSGAVAVAPDKFDGWDLALRALGFSPMKEAEYYEANTAQAKVINAINTRRNRLLREYAEARLAGESVSDIRKAIREFNEEHPNFRIKPSSLRNAVSNRRTNARKTLGKSGMATRNEKLPDLDRFTE